MIQFPLEMVSPPVVSGRAFSLSPRCYQPVISVRISLVNVMTMPRANGILTVAGGIVITFTKEILTLITG